MLRLSLITPLIILGQAHKVMESHLDLTKNYRHQKESAKRRVQKDVGL